MIPTTGRASESQHWYTPSGEPAYDIRGANGAMRPVTLRDARKLGLYPGVSAILSMEAKPQLTNWLIEQALLAALTLPRIDGESHDALLQRARTDSQEQARKARERGTALHTAIQGSFEGAPTAAEDIPYVESVRAWLAQRYGLSGWQSERSFAHPLGFGGKADLIHDGIPVVIDLKCKDFGEEKEAKDLAWPEHAMQLAAYREGFSLPKADCVNVFVSTRVPGLVRVREWDENEIADNWHAFRCLLTLWQIRKTYHPHLKRDAA